MSKRFVVYDDQYGIAIGCAMGFCFYTLLDTAGQDKVVSFDTIEDAIEFINFIDNNNCKVENVNVNHDDTYLSYDDMKYHPILEPLAQPLLLETKLEIVN